MVNFEEKNSIELLIKEIEKALNNELYLVALISALTIPDALCKIEYNDNCGDNYVKWVNEYVEDTFGRKYGERECDNHIGENSEEEEIIDNSGNDKYLKSPTGLSGSNCYQLRCSLIHDMTNEIKGNKKSGSKRKYLWIDECVLQCSKEEFIRGCSSGTDINLKEVDNRIVAVAEKYCYINVRELCYDIIRAAKKYKTER